MMVSADHDRRRAGTIWMLNLDEPAREITPLVPANFRRVDSDSVSALASSMGSTASAEITQRFETGRRCYAAWVENQIAAYGWVSFGDESIGELNLRIKLLPGEAYIWDCATLPAFRQKRLYSSLLTHILEELRAAQLCRAWIGADRNNIASQQGIARAGFHHIADLVVERVLALRQVWVQSMPGVPDEIVAEARRAFLNNRDKHWLDILNFTSANK